MAEVIQRVISRIRNGLQIDGKTNSSGVTIYLQDASGNVMLGKDAAGNFYGTILNKAAVAVTANSDGLTTAIIPTNASFVTVTSSGATQAASLPACSAATIGRKIDIYVGANGFELLTAASTNDTINTTDADGTNQLDVAASSLLRCVQVTATGWYAFQQTASALSVVAPDND